MAKHLLKISLSDLELLDDTQQSKDNIVCILFLNGNCVDKLYYKYKDYQSILPLSHPSEKVQLIFQEKDSGDLIGCISFPASLFLPLRGKTFTQWFTLFDCIDDDEFDGDIGEHDDEVPRAFVNFKVESQATIQPSQSITLTSFHVGDIEKNNYSNYNSILTENIASILPQTEEFVLRDNVPVHEEKQPEPVNRVLSFNEEGAETEKEQETHISNLDEKMADLMSLLLSSRGETDRTNRNDELSSIEPEQLRDLLALERMKVKMLEENLRQKEEQLNTNDKLYEDFRTKLQTQFKQLLEKNKELNTDNYNAKQKIIGLESQILEDKKESSEYIQKITQEHNQKVEENEALIEKLNLTIQNLEIVNEDLTQQYNSEKLTHTKEKEINANLQNRIEEIQKDNKENVDSLKEKVQGYFEQIQTLKQEKNELDIKCSNLELEVKGWEIKSQCLEQQNESSQKEIEALTQELEEYKQITNSLKASIVDIKDKKGKEILALSEKVLTLEEKLRKQKIEYDFLMVEKKEVEQELSSLRHLNYQSRIENLEDAFAESEEARKALQEELQQSENRMKLFLQHQKENSISAKAYEESIKEYKETVDEYIEKIEAISNDLDKVKYENMELKLKIEEYKEVYQQNTALTEKLAASKNDNIKLNEDNQKLREQLFSTSTDLIKQTNIALDGENVIRNLTQQMQTLDSSLRVAFSDIKQLHLTLHHAQKLPKPFETYIPSQNDEIDQLMSSFCNNVQLPVSFKRLSEGNYLFGTQNITVKAVNKRLYVQNGSNCLSIEEFIQFNANRELMKIKKGEMAEQPAQENRLIIVERPIVNIQEENNFLRDRVIQLQKVASDEEPTRLNKENVNESSPHSSSHSPLRSRNKNKRVKVEQDENQSQEFSFSPSPNKSQRSNRESPNKEEFIQENNVSPVKMESVN